MTTTSRFKYDRDAPFDIREAGQRSQDGVLVRNFTYLTPFGERRAAYLFFIERMAPLDPIAHVARLAPAPLLFQFGRDDPHVPEERGQAFYDAAGEPKCIRWYDCGHGLNAQAAEERIAWLCEQLRLS